MTLVQAGGSEEPTKRKGNRAKVLFERLAHGSKTELAPRFSITFPPYPCETFVNVFLKGVHISNSPIRVSVALIH